MCVPEGWKWFSVPFRVLPPCAQYSWDELWILHHPDQDKDVIEDEWMNSNRGENFGGGESRNFFGKHGEKWA